MDCQICCFNLTDYRFLEKLRQELIVEKFIDRAGRGYCFT